MDTYFLGAGGHLVSLFLAEMGPASPWSLKIHHREQEKHWLAGLGGER